MCSSKDINFFDIDDDDFFRFVDVEDSSLRLSRQCAQSKVPEKKEVETPIKSNVSSKLINFLHKFDFSARSVESNETPADIILKNNGEPKPHAELHTPVCAKIQISDLKSQSTHEDISAICVEETQIAVPHIIDAFDVSFDDFDDNETNSVDRCEKERELFKPKDPCEKVNQESVHHATTSVVPYEIVSYNSNSQIQQNKDVTAYTNVTEETIMKNEKCAFLSSPCSSSFRFKKLLPTENVDTPLKKQNLDHEPIGFKSVTPNGSFCVNNLATNYKSRKRKFPGPAGLLPDLPPKSPLAIKPYEHSIESNVLENSFEQDFLCSQTNMDEFLRPPWQNMMRDLSSHIDVMLLKHCNIKSVKKQASKKKLPKYVETPIFYTLLKSISRKESEIITIFKDETGEISGKIHQEVMNKYSELLTPGAAIIIKKAVFLLNQLTVKLSNIIRIYDCYGNMIQVNDWDDAHLISYGEKCMNSMNDVTAVTPRVKERVPRGNDEVDDDKSQDYIVQLPDESLFADDLDELILSINDESFVE